MESSGAQEIPSVHVAEGSETTIEIKIKTLDSQTYTLKVNKQMPVPALKEQIASVTGVLSEQQRLICRGKVLKDDQLLSAYHVEDGHTLHLVVRQPIPPLSEGAPSHAGNDPSSTNRGPSNHVSPSVVIETFNVPDQGEAVPRELSRIVSAVLGSFGITNFGSSIDGRSERTSGAASTANSNQPQTEQYGSRGPLDRWPSAFGLPAAVSMGQPPVIPDSLMTMSQYLSHIRSEFSGIGRVSENQASATDLSEGRDSNSATHPAAVREGLPTPASLAELMVSTRQMLTEEVADCLQTFAHELENQANINDPSMRSSAQDSAMRIGISLHYLGAYILELGRTAMTLRLGQTPSEAVVNAGPAIYISPSGPNPLMVQPLPFQMGTSFGSIPIAASHPSSNFAGGIGTSFLPRRIDIQIRRGSSTATTNASREERADNQQASVSRNAAVSSGGENLQPSSSGVRVVPIRTMVAAVPASFSRLPSDSSDSLSPPNVRVQATVSHSANHNTSAGETQNNQEHGRQLPGSVYQFLRSLFPGGEIHVEEDSGIGTGTGTATGFVSQSVEMSTPVMDIPQAEASASGDGIFLSNLLHQIMPFISPHSAVDEVNVSEPEMVQDSSLEAGTSDAGTSNRPDDPDFVPPNSKRQKRE